MRHREWVSQARDELKGLAILWVVWFHSGLALPGSLDLLRQIGYGGVDVFFFLMGIGLYRSLSRAGDLRGYLSRRLWRILPAYVPLVLLWLAVMYPGYGLSTVQAIRGVAGNLTMTAYWLDTPKPFNWFVSAQFLFILLAPLCYAVLTGARKPGLALLGMLSMSGALGLASVGTEQMMGISRLPVFLLGMAFAMDGPGNASKVAVRAAYGVAALVGLGALLLGLTRYRELLNDYGLYWYPFALLTPALCVGLGWLRTHVRQSERWLAPLRLLGQGSFEIYLLNIWLVEVAKQNGLTDAGGWAFLCLGNLAVGIGYHQLVLYGVRKVRH